MRGRLKITFLRVIGLSDKLPRLQLNWPKEKA